MRFVLLFKFKFKFKRELSSEQREVEGYRTAPSLRCSTGPPSRAGHLGERDASPNGLEFLGRGACAPLFLFPNPPLFLFSSIPSCTLNSEGTQAITY